MTSETAGRGGGLRGAAQVLAVVFAGVGLGCTPASGVDGDFVCDAQLRFDDEALERELQIALGWDPEGEDEAPVLTYAALLELRTLDASNAELTSLGGLECVQGIEQLTVAGNDIEDLGPVGGLKGLRLLDISRNPIRNLDPLADNRRLERLVARGSTLESLAPLAGASRLRHLDVSDNAISSVNPLAELRELETLVLSRNEVVEIDALEGLPGLVALSLDRNAVRDIEPLRGLVNVFYLDLDQNEITDLSPTEDMFSLSFLRASANPVQTLPRFDDTAQIEDLRVREIGLSDLDVVAPLARLRYLDAGDNEIAELGPLQGLPALRQAYLTNNRISSLDPLQDAGVLRILDVRGNEAVADLTPLAGAPTLDTLRVGASDQTPMGDRVAYDLGPLTTAQSLGRLVIQYGGAGIDFSPIAALPFLNNIGIVDTPLQNADLALLASLPNLRLLELSRVGLTDLSTLSAATNLQSLRLEGNALTDISVVEQWPLLSELVLRDNPDLVDVDVIALLGSLAYLDLRGTSVDDVAALLDNQAFRDGDRLDVRDTALDDGDCAVLIELQSRDAVVNTDLVCDD